MRTTIPLLLAPLLLTGSVAFSDAPRDEGPVPPGTVRCIDPHQIIGRRPERPNSVVFVMAGGITYRNDLIGTCSGVRRSTGASIVQIEVDSGRLCKNDRIRVFDPVEARNIGLRAFPHCRLGMFTPIPGR